VGFEGGRSIYRSLIKVLFSAKTSPHGGHLLYFTKGII